MQEPTRLIFGDGALAGWDAMVVMQAPSGVRSAAGSSACDDRVRTIRPNDGRQSTVMKQYSSPLRLRTPGIARNGAPVSIDFEGEPVPAIEGETVAAALAAAGITAFRRARDGRPRGVFCGMGVCYECLVTVDRRPGQRACMTRVRDAMQVAAHRDDAPSVPEGEAAPLVPPPADRLPEEDRDLLIIGAGPAGLAAAAAAARAGVIATVLDERPEPGGQYFKQLAPSHRFAARRARDPQFASGAGLIERVRAAGVEIVGSATVWSAHAGGREAGTESCAAQVEVFVGAIARRIRARQLIVAPGAYERPHPVPGWTFPGVMTTGAAQTLSRAYRVAPGSRVLIAGNGPLNLQVACELAAGGVSVAAVAEAAAPATTRPRAVLAALRHSPELMWKGLGYAASLVRRRVPVLYRHLLVRVEGRDDRVCRAVLARIDPGGNIVPGSERAFDVDAVCMGYGFHPSTELTRLLGCEHRWDAGSGSLAVARDDDGATTLPGVFVPGDGGGVGGAQAALAQGTLAGLAAARNLGGQFPPDTEAARRSARRELGRARRFQEALWRIFAAPRDFSGLIGDDVAVCRCESVTAGALRARIASGADETGALKRLTRAGMGRCQGRYCGPRVASWCAAARGEAPDPFRLFAPRFPVKPVPALALAREKPEWSHDDQGEPLPPQPPSLARAARSTPAAEAEVAIVGAGIIGICTAWELARDGVDVALIERDQPNAHASGNNAGSLHVQLLAYDFGDLASAAGLPAAQTLPLQRESARLWPQVAEALGADLEIARTGGLMVAETGEQMAQLSRKAELEARFGTPVEMIGGAELRELAPHLSRGLAGAAYCAEEGKMSPLRAGPAVLDAALAAGARLFRETEVLAIERAGSAFHLHTTRGPFRAGRLLNAAGGWAARIAAMLGVSLPVRASPIQLIVTEAAPPLLGHLLAYADRHLTMKQMEAGNLVIGGGWPSDLDPGSTRARVRRESVEGNLWVAHRVLPALRSLHVIRTWAAMNVMADGAPILGEVPGVPGFFTATTVNGLTLGPVLGRINADLLRTGRTGRELAPYTLDRFN